MSEKAYSIGEPAGPLPGDPRFASQEAAEIAALTQSYRDDNEIIAVWEDESGEVLAVAHAVCCIDREGGDCLTREVRGSGAGGWEPAGARSIEGEQRVYLG